VRASRPRGTPREYLNLGCEGGYQVGSSNRTPASSEARRNPRMRGRRHDSIRSYAWARRLRRGRPNLNPLTGRRTPCCASNTSFLQMVFEALVRRILSRWRLSECRISRKTSSSASARRLLRPSCATPSAIEPVSSLFELSCGIYCNYVVDFLLSYEALQTALPSFPSALPGPLP